MEGVEDVAQRHALIVADAEEVLCEQYGNDIVRLVFIDRDTRMALRGREQHAMATSVSEHC